MGPSNRLLMLKPYSVIQSLT